MRLTIEHMNEQYAHLIAIWHYEPPYDFYDMNQDQEDLEELLNPLNWQENYYSAHNEEGELIGYFVFMRNESGWLEIGLGMRPDLTGKGLGTSYIEAGLSFARERFAPTHFHLDVAAFNTRAIRAYERAGFVQHEHFMNPTNGNIYEFIHMVRAET